MSEISALLGVDSDDLSWRELGACRKTVVGTPDFNPEKDDWFFDVYETKDESKCKTVDQICMGCPVIGQCYQYGRDNKLEGVWGGVYLEPSGKVSEAKNRHKTDEEWDLIKELHAEAIK